MKTRSLLLGIILVVCVFTGLYLYQRPQSRPGEPVTSSIRDEAVSVTTSKGTDKPVRYAQTASIDSLASPAVMLALDEHGSYEDRKEAVNRWPKEPSEADLRNIRDFLLRPSQTDAEQAGQVFKNDLFNYLCQIRPASSTVGDLLVQVYRDRSQDQVIRDYAVQHLAQLYENADFTARDDQDLRRLIQNSLWQAISETDDSIAGTALIGLAHLSEISKDFDPDQIAKAALRMSAETGGGELARITAFQVCGRMKVAAAEPVLFQVAIGGETIPLRISAIGALGQVGDSQAKSLLMNILNGTEERLKRPAQQALLQIQSREEHSESAPRKAI